ncbi:MAG: hypothetical protein KDD82_30130, partial [Planctomycetes bacterium]|nr:hypothetical protein [Planctomycetota bacterium]
MSSTPSQARALLVRQLATQSGCSSAATQRLARELGEDAELYERLVREWVSEGCSQLGEDGPEVFLSQLQGLESRSLAIAADLRRAQALNVPELFRLGQLYALLGLPERAATAYRELWTRAELPLEYSLRLGAATTTSAPEFALAAADRIAETILTRDPDGMAEGPDLLRESPRRAALLLGTARDVALAAGDAERAASLARAASALWGRLEQPTARWSAMADQVATLVAAQQHAKARQVLTRWRDEAQEQGDAAAEAEAVVASAERLAEEGKLGHGASLLGDAVELYESVGEVALALALRHRQGDMLAREGSWDGAAKAYAQAREAASEAEDVRRVAELWVAEGECALRLGQFTRALKCGESAREDAAPETLARSTLLVAGVLAAAGDAKRALKALLRLVDATAPEVHARSFALRGDLALGRGDEAGAQIAYADAARAYAACGDRLRWAECLVAQAELALRGGDEAACGRLCAEADALDAPALDLRHELLQARLGDPEEAELLLEDAVERTGEEGNALDHLRALYAYLAFALATERDASDCLERIAAALEALRAALPEKLRARFGGSPWVGRLRGALSRGPARA